MGMGGVWARMWRGDLWLVKLHLFVLGGPVVVVAARLAAEAARPYLELQLLFEAEAYRRRRSFDGRFPVLFGALDKGACGIWIVGACRRVVCGGVVSFWTSQSMVCQQELRCILEKH